MKIKKISDKNTIVKNEWKRVCLLFLDGNYDVFERTQHILDAFILEFVL